jgi:hypothetical protein
MEIEDMTIKFALGHPEAHIRAQALILVKEMKDYDERKSRINRLRLEEEKPDQSESN